MKREHTTAARSLRAVALAITLVSVVTFAAVGYSAYADVSSVLNVSQTGSPAISARTVTQGDTATVYVNVTISNEGLLPLEVAISCQGGAGIACVTGSVTVPPGQRGTLTFQMTIEGASQFSSNPSALHINGTIRAELVPFAALSASLDLGSLFTPGGGSA